VSADPSAAGPIPVTRGAELVAPKRPLTAPAHELVDALFKAEAVKRTSFELGFERGAIRFCVV
jgi:hypothetical protein